ncbi:hypothetical protein IQ07DRAFT_300619 [Pyrenochaeta sp. DS3sAY3a]|nr:hypothetical protein IQ07DRAFT_300619 [Pyrenochaeta sp. DS3sAY3a]
MTSTRGQKGHGRDERWRAGLRVLSCARPRKPRRCKAKVRAAVIHPAYLPGSEWRRVRNQERMTARSAADDQRLALALAPCRWLASTRATPADPRLRRLWAMRDACKDHSDSGVPPNPGFQSESHLLKPGSRPKAWPPAIALHCTAPWRPSYTSPSTPHISNNSCSCLPRRSAQLRLPNHLRSCTRRRKTVSAEGGLLFLAMASLPMRVSDNGQISTSMPPRGLDRPVTLKSRGYPVRQSCYPSWDVPLRNTDEYQWTKVRVACLHVSLNPWTPTAYA